VTNGTETDVDCGGNFCILRCDLHKKCLTGGDCASGTCHKDVCFAATCVDQKLDGDETDVDCGGSCYPCWNGATCHVDADCLSDPCLNGICQPPPLPDLAYADLSVVDMSPGPDLQLGSCSIDGDCVNGGGCVCDDGSAPPCKMGTCCLVACNPGTRCDVNTRTSCLCDVTTCDKCCINGAGCNGPSCGVPGFVNVNCPLYCDSGPGTQCELCGFNGWTCVQGEGAPYCGQVGGNCALQCAGCCRDDNPLTCHRGDSDGACGEGGGNCVACPMGQRCVNHACVEVPDGG
jgi:hypothetical protein